MAARRASSALSRSSRHHAYAFDASPPQSADRIAAAAQRDRRSRFRRDVRRRRCRIAKACRAATAKSPTFMAAASSMPERSRRRRRSTASISTPRTPARSARRWRRSCDRCWGSRSMTFVGDGTLRLHPHPLPLPTRGRGFRKNLRLNSRDLKGLAAPSPLWGGVGVGVVPLIRPRSGLGDALEDRPTEVSIANRKALRSAPASCDDRPGEAPVVASAGAAAARRNAFPPPGRRRLLTSSTSFASNIV